jgi:hypothetical protein
MFIKLGVSPTEDLYGFHLMFRKTTIVLFSSNRQVVFISEMCCVFIVEHSLHNDTLLSSAVGMSNSQPADRMYPSSMFYAFRLIYR